MLTDDDLTRELEAAFRADAADLRYTGRVPTPRTGVVPWTAVPIAAATAAVLVLPQLGAQAPPTAAPPPAATPSASVPAAPVEAGPAMVSDEIELAGMTVRYRHAEGTPSPATRLFLGVEPPPDAEEVDLTGTPDAAWAARAWVGTSPVVGEPGLFVQAKEGGVGEHSFFTAEGITAADWKQMIETGSN